MTMIATYGLDNYDTITEFFQEPFWEDTGSTNKGWTFNTTGGRFGGGSILNIGSIGSGIWAAARFIPELPKTLFFGVSINIATTNQTDPFIRFYDTNRVEHANLEILAGGDTMNVNILGSLEGTFTITKSVWHRLEIKLTVDDSAGEFTVILDYVEVFSSTGIDTQNGTNAHVGWVQIQSQDNGSSTDIAYDDFTFHDDQGTVNNDFLGDIRIVTLHPDGAGAASDFTPLAGTNWESVDETPGPDADTTYVESSVAGHQDLYTVDDFVITPGPGIIHSATVKVYAKKTDAGLRSIKLLTRSGGVTEVSTEKQITTDYSYVQDPVEVDPDTGLPWTVSTINTIQIGVENT